MNRVVPNVGMHLMTQPNIGLGQAQSTAWLGLVALIILPIVPCAADTAGRAPAERYCVACHLVPEPALLSREVWRRMVLPDMGARLGITEFRGVAYLDEIDYAETIEPWLSLLAARWAAAPLVVRTKCARLVRLAF